MDQNKDLRFVPARGPYKARAGFAVLPAFLHGAGWKLRCGFALDLALPCHHVPIEKSAPRPLRDRGEPMNKSWTKKVDGK